MKLRALAILFLAACTPETQTSVTPPPPPPPPPAPVPLVLAVNPPSRKATSQPGTATFADNAAVTLSGDNSTTTGWTATSRHAWITMTSGSGTGTGTAAWSRNVSGLAAGTYVDTITITASGATGSPAVVIDTLLITTAPVPLALIVTPRSRSAAAPLGGAAPDDNVAVTLTGDNATTTTWFAGGARVWTSLANGGGTGSGSLGWHRNAAGLGVGTYVDTLTITANGAAGSPSSVIDTLRIFQPLLLALSPASRSVAITTGGSAAGSSATVTLTGENAGTATWNATKKKAWTTLTNATGTGSGTVSWSRSTASLAAGTFVDTISVTTTGATGSPATVIDTIVVSDQSNGTDPDLGINTSLHGKRMFPASDPWNTPVDQADVDPSSDAILGFIGTGKSLHPDFGSDPTNTFGYSYIVVPDGTQRSYVNFEVSGESDPGPYPIPLNPPIETGPDGHLFIITQHEWKLYEMSVVAGAPGAWTGYSGAIFDMTNGTQRPQFWTSADAAGLPMIPGMVRYDEVYETGAINHALRFTVQRSRQAFVPPATHWASQSTDPNRAPMGMRVRLKASFDISGYPADMQVILKALKKYGMMVADNGGDFFLSGITDSRWNNDTNNLLKNVHVSDFEVVKMNGLVSN